MATRNYNPINIKQFGRGMVTREEANRIPDDAAVYAQNVEIGSDGAFGPRNGCSLLGDWVNASTGKILSTHTCKLRDATEIPLRQRVVTASTKSVVEWYNSVANAWELLVDSLNQTARIAFVQWNTSSADRVYWGNGVQNFTKWTCVVSTVASNTATTITLTDSTSFPASGTVVVDGTAYAYTGNAANQLTGLSGLPAFSVGEGVAIQADTSSLSAVTLSNIMHAHVSRMYIGSGASFVYSKTGDPETYTYSTPRIPGDGGVENFPEGGGKVLGFASRDQTLIVMKENVLRPFAWDQRDISTNEIPVSKPFGFSPFIGPQHTFSIGSYLKEIFYVSRRGGLRQLTQVLQTAQSPTDALDILDLNDAITPTMKDFDFSEAVTVVHDKKVLVACMSATGIAGNDTVIVFDLRTKGLVLYKGWQVNSWFVYLGNLYFGNSIQPNCFKCFDGHTDAGAPIVAIWRTKQFDFGEPALRKETPLVFIEGLIGAGTVVDVFVNTDGRQVIRSIRYDGSYVKQTSIPNVLGIYELGSEPIAGLINAVEELSPFRVYITVPLIQHYLFDLIIKMDVSGGRFKIKTLSPNPRLQVEPPTDLKLSSYNPIP